MQYSRCKILSFAKLKFQRNCATQAAAPLTRISFPEQLLHCSFMIGTMLSFPTYVACNIVKWRKKKVKPADITCPEDDDD